MRARAGLRLSLGVLAAALALAAPLRAQDGDAEAEPPARSVLDDLLGTPDEDGALPLGTLPFGGAPGPVPAPGGPGAGEAEEATDPAEAIDSPPEAPPGMGGTEAAPGTDAPGAEDDAAPAAAFPAEESPGPDETGAPPDPAAAPDPDPDPAPEAALAPGETLRPEVEPGPVTGAETDGESGAETDAETSAAPAPDGPAGPDAPPADGAAPPAGDAAALPPAGDDIGADRPEASTEVPDPAPAAAITGGPTLAARAEGAPLPAARSFRMGFTPLPYDLTPEAFEETYIRIATHGDVVSHLLDEGVPWTAAASGVPFHPNVEADIARRLAGTRKGSKVFLSVTPLAQDRRSLAGEWAEGSGLPLPESLQGLPLDDPEVVSAFVGYALRMIDRFEPDYFAYAVEISDLAAEPEARAAFTGFAAEVYRAVKRVHPDLPVFPTWSLGNRFAFTDELRSFVEEMGPYADILAVSSYPYVWDGVGGQADLVPEDWFSKMAEVLPDKPFAISQTGFLSGTYRNLPSLVWISAGPEDQAAYVGELLQEAERLEAEFVIWYVPVDYDRLWDRLEQMGMSPWFAQWMRTGLWSADFQARPALEVWMDWFALPVWD